MAQAIKDKKLVSLFVGDDPSLDWETRVSNYAIHEGIDRPLAAHLAAIELGYKEVIEPDR